jgi:hypothetical protein
MFRSYARPVSGVEKDVQANAHHKARTATLAVVAALIAALLGAPGALADTSCPDGWVCGVVEPPVPPDQAGDPQPVTIGATQIPDVPPYVDIPFPGYQSPGPTACKAKHRSGKPTSRHCRKKRK